MNNKLVLKLKKRKNAKKIKIYFDVFVNKDKIKVNIDNIIFKYIKNDILDLELFVNEILNNSNINFFNILELNIDNNFDEVFNEIDINKINLPNIKNIYITKGFFEYSNTSFILNGKKFNSIYIHNKNKDKQTEILFKEKEISLLEGFFKNVYLNSFCGELKFLTNEFSCINIKCNKLFIKNAEELIILDSNIKYLNTKNLKNIEIKRNNIGFLKLHNKISWNKEGNITIESNIIKKLEINNIINANKIYIFRTLINSLVVLNCNFIEILDSMIKKINVYNISYLIKIANSYFIYGKFTKCLNIFFSELLEEHGLLVKLKNEFKIIPNKHLYYINNNEIFKKIKIIDVSNELILAFTKKLDYLNNIQLNNINYFVLNIYNFFYFFDGRGKVLFEYEYLFNFIETLANNFSKFKEIKNIESNIYAYSYLTYYNKNFNVQVKFFKDLIKNIKNYSLNNFLANFFKYYIEHVNNNISLYEKYINNNKHLKTIYKKIKEKKNFKLFEI